MDVQCSKLGVGAAGLQLPADCKTGLAVCALSDPLLSPRPPAFEHYILSDRHIEGQGTGRGLPDKADRGFARKGRAEGQPRRPQAPRDKTDPLKETASERS